MNERRQAHTVEALPCEWQERIERLDYAFQPIVNIQTGCAYGYEALLRNHHAAGFGSIGDVFDMAFRDGVLCRVDRALMEKAIVKFRAIACASGTKLFYNIDCRMWDAVDYHEESVKGMLERQDFPFDEFCMELTERHTARSDDAMFGRLRDMKLKGFKIAVDDCGTGFNGFELMYRAEPDYIKIDRFFIREMTTDIKKRLFVSSLVNISHLTGSVVVGEGVETAGEYYACREIGCDMIQGWLVAPPQQNIDFIRNRYVHIESLNRLERRGCKSTDQKYVRSQMQDIAALSIESSIIEIFDRFRQQETMPIPIVNQAGEPLGIISETSFKSYVYSRYGRELLENPSVNRDIGRFIHKCPIADIHTAVEKILEMYSLDDSVEGILMVENMKYIGFLNAQSLLKAINEKNIAVARDQNPLTGLPGNRVIHEYLTEAVKNPATPFVVVYFDIDHFKAYNDRYGFRNGDRVLRLLADILRGKQDVARSFVGHIGGDDFFMGIRGRSFETAKSDIRAIIDSFNQDVRIFYEPEALQRGYIVSADRDGNEKRFPLLSVSAAVLDLQIKRSPNITIGQIGELMAVHKKDAKQSVENISVQHIGPGADAGDKTHEAMLFLQPPRPRLQCAS